MGSMKVPAVIASSVICLAVGVGVGTVGATYLGLATANLKFWESGEEVNADKADKNGAPGPGDLKGKGMQMPKGGKGKGGKGPTAKAQLSSLIAKLDILTQTPLSLDDAQKKKIQDHLQGLGTLEELTEDEANKRLKGLLDVVKDHKEPLEVVGFPWPGTKGGGPPKQAANPFKEETGAKHLQSLEKRLTISAP